MNTMILGAGDPAPDFTAIAVGAEFGDGMRIRLGDYFDSQIVLYFYPQDHTPGCTAQACKLRDAWEEFGTRASSASAPTRQKAINNLSISIHCHSRSSAIPIRALSELSACGWTLRKTGM